MHKNNELVENREIYLSRDDREFNLYDDSWQLNKNVVVSVGWMSNLETVISDSFRKVIARCAEEYAPDTVYGLNAECRIYFKKMRVTSFDCDALISFRSQLKSSEEHRLAKVRMLIRNWNDWGYPGIDKNVISLLDSWRLKGVEKGKAIKRLDPETGPLTEVEMSGLIDAMLNAYVSGQLPLSDYALAAILVYSGRRPIQITSLKIKDLYFTKNDTINDYGINFPRAKQRFSKWRSEFNKYPITEDLWLLLDIHSKNVVKKVELLVGFKLREKVINELPLFPDYKAFSSKYDENKFYEICLTDFYHIERDHCNDVMKSLESKLQVFSERTGDFLKLATRRFRYTLGSNIAREGKGELIIAEALDHSDTQNVGVYVRNLPDVVERIDKAVALQLAPLAQAFQGVLVDSEDEAIRGNDISSRIGNGEVNVGSCGSYGFCGAMAPIACYTCKHFQPWIDGPHEIILDELLEKRDEVFRNTNDIKIASSNDRLILAVAQVIRQCKAKSSEQLMLGACDG